MIIYLCVHDDDDDDRVTDSNSLTGILLKKVSRFGLKGEENAKKIALQFMPNAHKISQLTSTSSKR